MAEFLHDMKAIADELTLAREPVTDEDLIVHIINQLGDEYANVAAVLKMRDTTITFADLFDKLVDHERTLLEAQSASPMVTVNTAQRFPSRPNGKPNSDSRGTPRFNNNGSRFTKTQPQQGWNNTPSRGASNHAYPEGASLHTLSEYGGPDEIVLGNGTSLPITHVGSLHGGASHAGNQHQ
ncbi:hypothetical protein L1987_52005 [Smallanthus sonchifolius]|uniref:Uncharacterized protein n=1 Tax=Smallanthus sonchifolius TaxID=185202 RepID=A0ACB9ESI1_9ASTR|nr:hypothetical protein L1987_52005 [Smallanthus sonchifolius]